MLAGGSKLVGPPSASPAQGVVLHGLGAWPAVAIDLWPSRSPVEVGGMSGGIALASLRPSPGGGVTGTEPRLVRGRLKEDATLPAWADPAARLPGRATTARPEAPCDGGRRAPVSSPKGDLTNKSLRGLSRGIQVEQGTYSSLAVHLLFFRASGGGLAPSSSHPLLRDAGGLEGGIPELDECPSGLEAVAAPPGGPTPPSFGGAGVSRCAAEGSTCPSIAVKDASPLGPPAPGVTRRGLS